MKNQLDVLLGKGKVREQIDLFPHLSMRLHTKAQYYFEARSKEDLLNAVKASYTLKIPLILLGGGSNIIFTGSEVRGLVVQNRYTSIESITESDTSVDIEVGSGTIMALFIQKLIDEELSGLEYHKGLPGTVGGALYMNSKWMHPLSYVSDSFVSATLIDRSGYEKNVTRDYFAFDYDYSILQKTHELLVSAVFRFQKTKKEILTQRAQEVVAYRKETQPGGEATCGCFFRNITEEEKKAHKLPTKSAGYLIDKAGMKGYRVGGFTVSEKHANFIINQGGSARPEDLIKLVKDIKEKVHAKYGVELKEEVEIL